MAGYQKKKLICINSLQEKKTCEYSGMIYRNVDILRLKTNIKVKVRSQNLTPAIFGVYASHLLGGLLVSGIAQFIIIHTCLQLILLPSHYPLQNLCLSLNAQTLNLILNVFTFSFCCAGISC